MSVSRSHSTQKTPHALHVEGVGRTFGALEALKNISLTIPDGERHAILGPNGAGKTTLFNVISGDLAPTSGRIHLLGEDVTRLPVYKRIRIGLRRTYQNTLLFGDLTVFDNLYLAVRGVKKNRLSLKRPQSNGDDVRQADELAERVGLQEVKNQFVNKIAHGQQRQLEIGMALAGTPKVALLDEPVAGLSPMERIMIRDMLHDLPKSITLVMIEHDMDVALTLADQVTILHQGQVVTQGTPQEIQKDKSVQDIFMGGHVYKTRNS